VARNFVIAAAMAVATVLIARAIVSRLRPSPDQAPAWPPLTPVTPLPERTEVESAAPDEVGEAEPPETVTADESGWVQPVDDACPTSHPIKAKLASGIFHSPGGLNYDRTKPDRCYSTVEAAQADGLRPAKR
jgi:hypothetical protein